MKERDILKQAAAFWNTPLDEEEQRIEASREAFRPASQWVGDALREAAQQQPVIHYAEHTAETVVTVRRGDCEGHAAHASAARQGRSCMT